MSTDAITRTSAFHRMRSFQGRDLAAVRTESNIYDCEIEGRIPDELAGALYRVGGDRYYPTLEDDVIINGDGLFSMFRFENGHADFISKYVRTPRLEAEQKARRRLYGKYRNKYTDEPDAPQVDRNNTGNTYAHWHGGKLMALREDSLPYTLDPETLETKEQFDFGGQIKSISICAHPKVDPVTGEWWGFGLFADGNPENPVMSLQVADPQGNLVREEFFTMPFAGLSHDFAVTREHVIFDVQPLIVDMDKVRNGCDFYAYDPNRPSAWGIMPRNGTTKDIRWFWAKHTFSGHIMNAFTEGDKVYVDATISPGNGFSFFNDIHGNQTPIDDGFAHITRLEFDLAGESNEPKQTRFEGTAGEMPRLDLRYQMSRYRWGFSRSLTGIQRLDWDNMTRTELTLPNGVVAQEPLFVPRSDDAPEGDGFVLSMVNYMGANRAELYVLDAMTLEEGPIARVKLPYAQSFSFHGSFVPLDVLSAR